MTSQTDRKRAAVPKLDAPRLSVGFLLLPNFTLCAFANFIDVLRLAADEGDRSRQIRCHWRVMSPGMEPVSSSCGVAVQPHGEVCELERFDYLVVVGGIIGDEAASTNRKLNPFLRKAAKIGIPLVGLCTGSIALHQAGLMSGYRCCASWFHDAEFLHRFEGLKAVTDQIFVVDRDRLTCSGGVSTAHLAAFLVERHLGRAIAAKSLRIMMLDGAASGDTPQPASTLDFNTVDPIVKKSLLIMQQHIDMPLSFNQIAALVKVDKRRIERHFRTALSLSPGTAYSRIRLEHARYLLMQSRKSIASIAAECGYCDSAHLGRSFRRSFGVSPSAFRASPHAGPNALPSRRIETTTVFDTKRFKRSGTLQTSARDNGVNCDRQLAGPEALRQK